MDASRTSYSFEDSKSRIGNGIVTGTINFISFMMSFAASACKRHTHSARRGLLALIHFSQFVTLILLFGLGLCLIPPGPYEQVRSNYRCENTKTFIASLSLIFN